jgi:excisionase family DNA binding protein
MLGVNPATLRQWTKAGKLKVYRTPGGHRRFSADELRALRQPTDPEPGRSPAEAVIADLSSKYRGFAHSAATHQGWLANIEGENRLQFQQMGDEMLSALGAFLTAESPTARQRALTRAEELGSLYGIRAHRLGASATDAVEAYLLFRRPLLDVLAISLETRRDPPDQLGRIMRDAERFMDTVLVAISAGGARPESDECATDSGGSSRIPGLVSGDAR